MTVLTHDDAPATPINRPMVLASVMAATVLTALDQTIANVALPHIAGSVSASQEQIAWVLTSYIVTAAICMPLTGWLTGRLGRKRLMLLSVGGFVGASALCGAAQNLQQIVLFRVLQGAAGAALMPLSQALILDIYEKHERGPAMSIWSMGSMAAPIFGPVLGGWLTDAASWRWCFYLNLPVGALALLGIFTFVPDTPKDKGRPLDLVGFAFLGVAIAAVQLMFDRGQSVGWFESPEIITYAAITFLGIWFTIAHSLTSKRPFLPIAVFKDRTYVAASAMMVFMAMSLLSAITLVPLLTQNVLGFSVVQAGMLSAPRGVGTIISMLLAGRLMSRIGERPLILLGISIFGVNFWHMGQFTLDTSEFDIALAGFIQGLGAGVVFMPLTTMAFNTLMPELRTDATAFFNLMRNLGGSAGISLMLAMQTNAAVRARADLVMPYSPDSAVMAAGLPPPYSLTDPTGMAILSSAVDRQSAMLGYTQAFQVIAAVSLLMVPLVWLLKPSTSLTMPQEPVTFE